MDGSVWRKWALGGLVFLVIMTMTWTIIRWANSEASEPSAIETSSLKFNYQLLRGRSDSIGGNWLRTLNPKMKDVQGDLIWNSALQEGVMRFINLPAPGKDQRYRLWIHDSRATDGQPLLGAELDAGSGKQELFAAITAKASVMEPFKFVLTLGKTELTQPDDQIMLMVQP
ncbi:MAG: hypothetical protein ACPGVP_11535 [Thiolinea sp.]